MNSSEKKRIYTRFFALRIALVLFDILAVNAAYYLALLVRFYVAFEFHSVASGYIEAFAQFAPYYTVASLVVFGSFKLYSGLWKYAGVNDMNRIFGANLVTALIQVVGTCLFVRRMPITYYAIGAMVQFCLIAASRFSYRILVIESGKVRKGKNGAALNAMVIGSGETGRIVLKQLERENAAHPVCAFNYKDNGVSGMVDGVPMVSGMDNLESTMQKYKVNYVIIADSLMPKEIRKQIKDTCKGLDVEAQDFSGYFENGGNGVTLKTIAEYSVGPVELVIDGKGQQFEDGEQALMSVTGQYTVKSVSAKNGTLVIELRDRKLVLNDLSEEWAKNQEKETGESISFF